MINATSCSSENAVVIVDEVYDAMIEAFKRAGGYMAKPEERTRIIERLWVNGQLNRSVIAQGPDALIKEFELAGRPKAASS